MTDFTEQVNLQRALEGELARTITSLSEIFEARVHIVLAKDSLFEDRKEEAKASVAVQLKKGEELSKSSIAGIKGLVAGAVPGLRTHNVSIVDNEGQLLAPSAGSGDGARAEVESGIREQLEKEMVGKVISILEPLVGKGKVHANTSIDLDFNSTEQTEETFNPSPNAVLSQQKSEERIGSTLTASGIPGTQSNTASAPPQAPGTTPDRLRQSEITNYEVSKLVRHTVQPKGTIRRISVAVILDHKAIHTKGKDGKVTTTFQPRERRDLDAYRELVLAAVGFDKERGDTVTLENVPFFNETRPVEDQPPLPWYLKYQWLLLPALKYTSFLILFLLVYLVLFRPIRKRVFQSIAGAFPAAQERTLASGAEGAAPKAIQGAPAVKEVPAVGEGEAAGGEEGAAVERPATPESLDDQIEREFMKEAQLLDAGSRKYAIMRKKLSERAKREPELVSQLIRSWIREKD
jgi:flagellar M-ring protein FliF